MKNGTLQFVAAALSAVLLFTASGCSTLRELAALRDVKFVLDSVSEVQLAGIDMNRSMKYDDFGVLDLARLGRELANNRMPLTFRLNLGATNPADNSVQARLVRLDWTLLIEDRETVSGVYDDEVILPPGEKQMIPFGIELDLIEFFGNNLRDLAELALSLADQGGAPKNIKLRAIPTVDTPIGPIRYPEPIMIVNNTVG